MIKKYKITLTPLNRFYFGGESSFATGDLEWDRVNSSYIITSAYFPQQTSLLGMLRFLILSNREDLFDGSRIISGQEKEVVEWIGEKSFTLGNTKGYGKLKKISPCFLQITRKGKREKIYLAPKDRNLQFQKNNSCFEYQADSTKISVKVGKTYVHGNEISKLPFLWEYDAKKGIQDTYVGNNLELCVSDIFKPDLRIGIRRNNKTGKTLKNAFYKQIFYRFANRINDEEVEISFAFEVIAEEGAIPLEAIVELGGDASKFKLKVEFVKDVQENEDFQLEIPDTFWGKQVCPCHSKAVLLSDAYIENPTCLFDISETKPFRFLITEVETTKEYHKFGQTNEYPSKREKYNLYEKGSVFYFEDIKQQRNFIEKLNRHPEFVQIGYNRCVIKSNK